MIKSPWLLKTVQVVIALLVVFILFMTAVRLLLTDAFLKIEYNMPNFPADTYGMTKEQRLQWAPFALEYLLNSEGISFLGDLTFADGSQMYNERELSHMLDVKLLVQQALKIWYAGIALFLAFGLWSWFGGWWQDFRRMLSKSGLFTVGLLGTLVLLVMISFDQIFTGFHRIFFQGDSWLFRFSDTLIRLFPLRFWQDAFIFVGVFTFVGGLLLWRLVPSKKISE